MILSDGSILELQNQWPEPLITPFNEEQLQPASYDVLLGEIDPDFKFPSITLLKGDFVIASTLEYVNIPEHIVARLEGKSSLARKGLIIHAAGFIDPGFKGQITLEIFYHGDKAFTIKSGMRIGQLAFTILDKPAVRPYGHPELGSHYQNQVGATRSYLDQ